jgi:hypothetical protein
MKKVVDIKKTDVEENIIQKVSYSIHIINHFLEMEKILPILKSKLE